MLLLLLLFCFVLFCFALLCFALALFCFVLFWFVSFVLFLSSSLTRDAVRARGVDMRKAQELDNSRRQENKLPWS